MQLDVYGRFRLEVRRETGRWIAYRIEPGKRVRVPELAIPDELSPAEIPAYLDDIYHEVAGPGQMVRILSEPAHGQDGDA